MLYKIVKVKLLQNFNSLAKYPVWTFFSRCKLYDAQIAMYLDNIFYNDEAFLWFSYREYRTLAQE